MRIFELSIHMRNDFLECRKKVDEQLRSVSFLNNIMAMYCIGSSWCEAVPNTVLAVAVLGGDCKGVRSGIRIAKLGYFPHAPIKWLKSCGRCARIFWCWFECNRTNISVLRYESQSERPHIGFSTFLLITLGVCS